MQGQWKEIPPRHHAFCLLLHTKHLLTKHTAPPDKASRAMGHGSQVIVTSIMSFVPRGILVKRFITLVLLTRKQRPGDVKGLGPGHTASHSRASLGPLFLKAQSELLSLCRSWIQKRKRRKLSCSSSPDPTNIPTRGHFCSDS